MIGYLTGDAIRGLIAQGVTQVWYDVSTTPQYRGDLTSVYFLDDHGMEYAHQTQLSGALDIPEITMLKRSWGGKPEGRGYTRSLVWDRLRGAQADLSPVNSYRVVP